MSSISTTIRRVDSPTKIAGSEEYLADMRFAGSLHSRLVLSDRSRARITSIHVPQLPAGYATVDHTDIPGRNQIHVINDNWPLFPEDVVEYVGQPILMIVGPDPAVLDDVVRSTEIEYEDLNAVLGLTDAEALPSPPVFVEYQLESGVPVGQDTGTADLSETFDTGPQEHIYLEPQAMAAWYEDEKINVVGSTQCPFYIRTGLMGLFGWGSDRVRVVQAATGGGFGGKEEWPSLLAGYVAVAAYKVRKPVRIVLDRSEDIRITTKRHPSRTSFSTLAGADGVKKTSIDARIDGGAFEGLSSTVLQRMMFSATGAYRVPPATVRGRAYQTNIVPYGAFRGFGSPQAFFAIEMHMNHLAQELGIDPLEFKRRQLLAQGGRTITGGTLRDPIKMHEMIDIALEMSGYTQKRTAYSKESAKVRDPAMQRGSIIRRGIGISLFSHGCGFTGNGERDIIKARVRLRHQPSGVVEILAASVEMGQGAETTLRKIVARTLEMPIEQVIYAKPDTDRVPDSGPTVASRTSMIVGGLLHRAATKLKDRLETAGSEAIEVEAQYEQPEEIEWDQTKFRGDAYPGFSWGVNVIEIELDMITYAVQPTNVWAVYDIGTAIDEQVVIGQVHGGIVQGLGYAISENLEVTDGRFQQHTMTDYIIPGSLDVPPIEVRLVSNPHRYGPFGAKGAGEIPFTGVAPAVADAVENALGKRVYRVPLIPEYLEEADR